MNVLLLELVLGENVVMVDNCLLQRPKPFSGFCAKYARLGVLFDFFVSLRFKFARPGAR